jgi:putative phosphoesterase
MKLAVFSDIHANLTALRACQAFADHLGADGYVLLGDYVSDCPDPHATLEHIRTMIARKPCYMVYGNREQYLFDHEANLENDGWCVSSQTGSLLYTFRHLTAEDFKLLHSMPRKLKIEIPGCAPVLACHGAPESINQLIYPGTRDADKLLKNLDEAALLVGHCHVQYRYEAFGKQLINPGSLGMPMTQGLTKAQFAMLTDQDGRWQARMLNVPYDSREELARFDASSLDQMGLMWTRAVRRQILSGGNVTSELRKLADRIAQEMDVAGTPEACWEEAAKRLELV